MVKLLSLSQGKCQHTNIVRICHNTTDEEAFVEPMISTNSTKQEGNVLKHSTEVKYNRQRYNIQDVFSFSNEQEHHHHKPEKTFISSSMESGNSQRDQSNEPNGPAKKLYMFRKKGRHNPLIRRDTKNVPKNFCKAFSVFMEGLPSREGEDWRKAMKDFRRLESKNKYNNILIQKLLSNGRIVPFFKEFLTNHAADWIEGSKIADKEVHVEAIRIYTNLINSLTYVEQDPNPSDE